MLRRVELVGAEVLWPVPSGCQPGDYETEGGRGVTMLRSGRG